MATLTMPVPVQPVLDLCDKCGLIHPPMVDCVMAQQRAIREILLLTGRLDKCSDKRCRQNIYWVTTLDGRPRAYNESGISHVRVCNGQYRR